MLNYGVHSLQLSVYNTPTLPRLFPRLPLPTFSSCPFPYTERDETYYEIHHTYNPVADGNRNQYRVGGSETHPYVTC